MDSPFKDLLYTNYVPSIHEVNQIQQLVTPYDNELSFLDAEIHRLQQQLKELRGRRDTLSKDVDAHKALISLIRRLPREVLEEIFIACLPDDRNPCMIASDAPVLLTRICSSWRNVALSAPALWARIHIVLPTHSPLDPQADIEATAVESKIRQRETAVNEWLARSGSFPLSISVYQAFRSPSYPSFARDLFQLSEDLHISFYQNALIPHARRWCDVRLFTTLNTFSFLQKILPSNLPMLRKLHVSSGIVVRRAADQYNIWQDVFLQSPHLQAITLSLPLHPIRLPDIKLLERWPQLTDLGLRIGEQSFGESANNYPTIIHTLLQSCPLLESLRLYVETIPFDIMPRPKSGKVILRNLKTLGFATTSKLDFFWPIFHALVAPSLQHFELDYIQSWGESNTMSADAICIVLKDFLTSFGANLLSWRFRPIAGLQSSHLLGLLKLTPCLQELSFTSQQPEPLTQWYCPYVCFNQCDGLDDGLICGLTPSATEKDNTEVICPRLEVFKCITGIVTDISEKVITEFIRARRQSISVSQIRHFEIALAYANEDGDTNFKQPPYSEEGVTGGMVYMRTATRRANSAFTGFPFSLEEISKEVTILR